MPRFEELLANSKPNQADRARPARGAHGCGALVSACNYPDPTRNERPGCYPDARYRLATRTSPRDGRLSAPPRGAHRTLSNHGDMRRDLALIAWTASAAGIRPQSTRACTSAHPAPSASSSISTCAPMEAPRRTQSRNKMQEDSHWMLSHPIRGHQRPSEAIRGHQRPSKAIRGHQRPSEAIRGHQRPS